jgi:hypothetical protein
VKEREANHDRSRIHRSQINFAPVQFATRRCRPSCLNLCDPSTKSSGRISTRRWSNSNLASCVTHTPKMKSPFGALGRLGASLVFWFFDTQENQKTKLDPAPSVFNSRFDAPVCHPDCEGSRIVIAADERIVHATAILAGNSTASLLTIWDYSIPPQIAKKGGRDRHLKRAVTKSFLAASCHARIHTR